MLELDNFLSGLRGAAESTRLRLLVLCDKRELTVTELTQILGQSQPRVSRHLKLMVDAGLLERFREGTWAFYRLAQGTDGAELARNLVVLAPTDDQVLVRDNERLEAIKEERAKAAAEYFRKNAAQWDEIRRLHVDDTEVEKALLALLGDGSLGAVLDLGTGTGRMLQVLGPSATRGLGVDLSREMLAVARANLERAGLENCSVRLGDIYGLNVEDGEFDLVTLHHVLHFTDDPARAITEAARVLAPGGRAVVVDFAPHQVEHLRIDHAHRRLGFSDAEITAWCRAAGLELTPPVALPGDPLTVKIWLARCPARRTP
jgi:ArsR family transcriptional regulator